MRKLVCLIFCLFVIVSLSTVCFAETITKTDQKIMYENNYVIITEPIVNIDGNLYVPIRTFCEKIGYTVDWTRESITIKKDTAEFLILEKSYTYVENKAYIGLRALGKLLNQPVDYDNNTRTALVNSNKENLKITKKIMLDAGHGAEDPGAIGNGVEEKEVNLYIAKKVQEKLLADGYTVLMTREEDIFLSLSERYNYANTENVDLFISIHNNSADNTSAKGTEVLCHFDTDSVILAENILNAILQRIDTTNRGLKDGSRMAVIRNTNMPAVIVEGLFISNKNDANMLKDKNVLDAIADGIYVGIINSL